MYYLNLTLFIMKKITFLLIFLASTSLGLSQTLGLFDLNVSTTASTLNVSGGSTITINNTLANCLPNDDGTLCDPSNVTYELDFYLVDGQNEYLLYEASEFIVGYNCDNTQSWNFNSPNYNFTVPCYIPTGSYSLRVKAISYTSFYFWNLSASSTVAITAGGSVIVYGGYPGGEFNEPYPFGDIATVNVTNNSNYVSDVTFSTVNATCSDLSTGSATVNPVGGSGNFSYLWSNGQTGQTATNLSAGTYTVEITDNVSGCTVSSATFNQGAVVGNDYNVNVSLSSVHICGGNPGQITANASSGVGQYGYSWNTGQSTSSISVPSGGNYIVEVEDANGCTASASVEIVESGYPTLSGREEIRTCNRYYELCGYADEDPNGNYTYQWFYYNQAQQQMVLVANTPCFPPVITAGFGYYTVLVTNEYGCTSSHTVNVLPGKGCNGANPGGGSSAGLTATVYPNPIGAGETFRVEMDAESETAMMEIVDVKTGKIVLETELRKGQAVEHVISELETGNGPSVYYVKIYTDTEIVTKRLIVK